MCIGGCPVSPLLLPNRHECKPPRNGWLFTRYPTGTTWDCPDCGRVWEVEFGEWWVVYGRKAEKHMRRVQAGEES